MDGRLFRKWWLSGCLAIGALGCNRNAVHSPWDPVGPGSPVPGPTAKKSFWPSSTPVAPIEVTETATKGPPKPETEVAIADVRLAAAFDELTVPSSRQGLLDQARQGYQKAIQQDSKNKAAQLGLARYYVRVNERDKAVEMYKKYLAANPTDREVAHEVAYAHAQWRDWAGAVSWCEFTLKIDPENLSVRKTMAFCLARNGEWERGFKVMCKVMPEAQARYLMARALEHQNHPDACRQQLQLALKADAGYTEAREFLAELDGIALPVAPSDPNTLRQAGFTQQP